MNDGVKMTSDAENNWSFGPKKITATAKPGSRLTVMEDGSIEAENWSFSATQEKGQHFDMNDYLIEAALEMLRIAHMRKSVL